MKKFVKNLVNYLIMKIKDKIEYNDKLIIRHDNEKYLKKYKSNASFDNSRSGFDIAKNIMNYKNSIK